MTVDGNGDILFRQLNDLPSVDSPLLRSLVVVWRDARRGRLAFLLDLHDAEEDRRYLRDTLLPQNTVWVAESGNEIAGFIAFADGWVQQLYVAPAFQRRGIGAALLSVAKDRFPELRLWVFEENTPAISFYQSQGFAIAARTDGGTNEARRPDVRMEWRRKDVERSRASGH